MIKKSHIATFLATVAISLSIGVGGDLYAGVLGSSEGGGSSTPASASVQNIPGTNSIKVNVSSAGKPVSSSVSGSKPGKSGSGKNGGSGNGGSGSSAPSCYKWVKAGNALDFLSNVDDVMGNGQKFSAQDDKGKAYQITQAYGSEGHRKTSISNMTVEQQNDFASRSAFVVVPNPAAVDAGMFRSAGNDNPNAPCGSFDGQLNSGFGFITGKHIAGDNSAASMKRIASNMSSGAEGKFSVELTEQSKSTYTAKIDLGDANTNMVPNKINKITYIWSIRVPNKQDPVLKTNTLSAAGYSSKSPKVQTYPVKVDSSLGILKTELVKHYPSSNPESKMVGGQYGKNPSLNLFQDSTKKHLKTLTLTEGNVGTSVNDYQIIDIRNKTSLSDTLTLSSSMLSSLEGKYIVNVSVVLDGTYYLDMGGSKAGFTFPLGFASDSASQMSSSCSSLAASLNKYKGMSEYDFKKNPKLMESLASASGQICKDESWIQGPIAIADVSATGGGMALLDGSQSKAPILKTTKYAFEIKYTDVACKDPENEDPECKEKAVQSVTKKVLSSTTKNFKITRYYWYDQHRIKMNNGKYEIDFDGKANNSANSIMTAKLNNGNTYACLTIATDAPGFGTAGASGNIYGVSYKKTYEKTDRNKGRGGKSPLEVVSSNTFTYCDEIITEEKDRRVIENWGK